MGNHTDHRRVSTGREAGGWEEAKQAGGAIDRDGRAGTVSSDGLNPHWEVPPRGGGEAVQSDTVGVLESFEAGCGECDWLAVRGAERRMNRLFLANLSCEADWTRAWQRERGVGGLRAGSHQVAGVGLGAGLPAGLQRAIQQEGNLQSVWLGLMSPGDRVLDRREGGNGRSHRNPGRDRGLGMTEARRDEGEWGKFGGEANVVGPRELIAWGATDEARRLSEELGCVWCGPDPALAMRFNQRSERFQIEEELEFTLPGSLLIRSCEDLQRALSRDYAGDKGWILKANFGMSGREAIRGRGACLTTPQVRFCESRSVQTGPLVLEPILTPVEEVGVLWEILAGGVPEFQGMARQWVVGGTWRGCLFFDSDHQPACWEEAIRSTARVTEKLAIAGYRGPLGIDVMWHRDASGDVALRPLQDLNARWTMGRMGLAWQRRLGTPPAGAWIWGGQREARSDCVGEVEVANWLGPDWRVQRRVATFDPAMREGHSEAERGPLFVAFEPVAT